jgi:hypothetical protein
MRARGIEPSSDGAVPALARMTGMDVRYLYRWFNGEARPNADNTIDLLNRAGLLDWRPQAPTAAPESVPASDTDRELQELRTDMDELKGKLDAILSTLTRTDGGS